MPIPNSTQLQRTGHWWLKTWLVCIVKETTKQKTEENIAALQLLLKNYRYTKLFSKNIPIPKSQNHGFQITPQGKPLLFLEAVTQKPRPGPKGSPNVWLLGGKNSQPTQSLQISVICHHFPAPWITTFILWENLVVPGISSPACAWAHPSFTDKESALCGAMAQSRD